MITPLSKPLMYCRTTEVAAYLGRELCRDDYFWNNEIQEKSRELVGAIVAYLNSHSSESDKKTATALSEILACAQQHADAMLAEFTGHALEVTETSKNGDGRKSVPF